MGREGLRRGAREPLLWGGGLGLSKVSSRHCRQLRAGGEHALLSWLPLMPGLDPLLDQQTLTPLLKSAPTGDELHLACEMKIAKPLIESKLSGSSSSAQSTFAKMNDTMTVF